jgi:putative transposase
VARRRLEVRSLQTVFSVSERRTLRGLGWPRSSHRYESRRRDVVPLRMRLRDLAFSRPRFGYRRLTVLLRREGWRVNPKRVYRLYRDEGLWVRVKHRRKHASLSRAVPPTPARRNERWAMDFVSDTLADGRKIRLLTVIDMFTRESLAIHVAQSLPSSAVTHVLEELIRRRGPPEVITVDNGTEFTSNHFDVWAFARRIRIDYIRPGKPVENAWIESFNGRLRDECLNAHWFETLDEARTRVEDWRRDYNEARPHSALADQAPSAYVAGLLARGQDGLFDMAEISP